MHSPCVLPVFRSPDDDALFLLQLVLRAVFLSLDGIEHLFLLLRGDTRRNGLLPLLVAFALLVRLRRILLPVALLFLVVALLLLVIALLALVVLLPVAVLFVLSAALLLLILVLVFVFVFVLVLVVVATAAVLVVV